MTKSATAKVFMSGRSQAVRLPKEFRLTGKEVRVRREGNALILEPMAPSTLNFDAWMASIDEALGGEEFLPEGVDSPPPTDDGGPSPFDVPGLRDDAGEAPTRRRKRRS